MKQKLPFLIAILLPVFVAAQTTFLPKATINANTGAQPYALDSEDIDGDGFIDLILGTAGGNTLEWYKNNGDGTFVQQTSITNTLQFITSVELLDLNGDGILDLAANGFSNNTIAWFQGDENGNFGSQQTISSTIPGATDFVFADVDNNGNLDMMAAAYNGNSVLLFEGDGTGNFNAPIVIDNTINSPGSMSMNDIDNDGDLDLVVSTASFTPGANNIQIYFNDIIPNGTTTFTKEANPVTSNKLNFFNCNFEDVDNDGNFDILATELGATLGSGAFYWYEFNGSGYTETPIATSIGNPASVKMIDLDNDGQKDIVLSSGSSGVGTDLVWYKNLGSGNFSSENIIDATQSQAYVFTVADFDNDGDLDIISGAFNQNDLNYFENELFTLSVNTVENSNISLYPNPTYNLLYLKGIENTSHAIIIYNQFGQKIFQGIQNENEGIDVKNYASGIYFLQLIEQNITIKFLKQ